MATGVQLFTQLRSVYGSKKEISNTSTIHSIDILTGGGTGTHDIDVLIDEVTDIQAGSYVAMDMEYKVSI